MRDGFRVFDVHSHIGEWGSWEMKGREVDPFPDEITSKEDLESHMEKWGVDRQVVMTHYHPDLELTFERNDLALELAELDGVYAGIFFHPDYPELTKNALEKVDSNVKVLKTSADAWTSSYSPDSWSREQREVIEDVVRTAKNKDLVFQFHTGKDRSDPRNAFDFIDEFPGARYHLVHMGGIAGGHFALVPRLLERLDLDIRVDTSWSRGFAPKWLALELKKRDALDRMMFGTDYPWGDFPSEYHKVTGLEEAGVLTGEEVQQVLFGNAEAFYLE